MDMDNKKHTLTASRVIFYEHACRTISVSLCLSRKMYGSNIYIYIYIYCLKSHPFIVISRSEYVTLLNPFPLITWFMACAFPHKYILIMVLMLVNVNYFNSYFVSVILKGMNGLITVNSIWLIYRSSSKQTEVRVPSKLL